MKSIIGFGPVLIALVSFSVLADQEHVPYNNARIIWQTEEPTCFNCTLPLDKKLEAVPRFMVGSEMTEPVMINGPKPTVEEMNATGERPWGLVFELVINAAGNTELVVSLKDGYPRMEALVAGKYSQWNWEPSTIDGKPVCVRYILTHRIHYQ